MAPAHDHLDEETTAAQARRLGVGARLTRLAAPLGRARLRSATVLLALLALLATGAGAATGTVLRSELSAQVTTTIGQALAVDKPQPDGIPPGRRFFSSTSDDHTKFSIALELFRGDTVSVLVPIVNRSSNDTVALFSVVEPEIPSLVEGVPGLVLKGGNSGVIDDVVQISQDTWTFTADATASGDDVTPPDALRLTFKVAPTAMSGFFEMSGKIRTSEF